jgi:hypothetical protein
MWSKSIINEGQRFGNLVVIQELPLSFYGKDLRGRRTFLLQCDCGNQTKVSLANLSGHTKSCGCLKTISKRKLDINIGDRYGYLVVLSELPMVFHKNNRWGKRSFLMKCDCGNEVTSLLTSLKEGHSKSCGCYRDEMTRLANKTHGDSGSVEFKTWLKSKERCYNENAKSYKDYGGRGIIMSDEWLNSYETFLKDMGRRPTNKHSIERLNVNGNYEKSNCIWADKIQQANNTRTNRFIEYSGDRYTISQWARIFNTKPMDFRGRLERSDWSIEKMIVKFYPQFTYLKEAV